MPENYQEESIQHEDNRFYNTNVFYVSLQQYSKIFSLMLAGSQSRRVKECIQTYIVLVVVVVVCLFFFFVFVRLLEENEIR